MDAEWIGIVGVICVAIFYTLWQHTNCSKRWFGLFGTAGCVLIGWFLLAAVFISPTVEKVEQLYVKKIPAANGTFKDVVIVDNQEVNLNVIFQASLPEKTLIQRIVYGDSILGLRVKRPSRYKVINE